MQLPAPLSQLWSASELPTTRYCLLVMLALWLLGMIAPRTGSEIFGLIPGK